MLYLLRFWQYHVLKKKYLTTDNLKLFEENVLNSPCISNYSLAVSPEHFKLVAFLILKISSLNWKLFLKILKKY